MITIDKKCHCPGVDTFNPGLYGSRADHTKQMMILHFSDSRAPRPHSAQGYKKALLKSQTGQIITQLLDTIKQDLDDFYVTNYVKCLLPNDRSPRRTEYDRCKPLLIEQIETFSPEKIVLFGQPVYEHFFGHNNFSGNKYTTQKYNNTPVFVSEHPGFLWRQPRDYRFKAMKDIAQFLQE